MFVVVASHSNISTRFCFFKELLLNEDAAGVQSLNKLLNEYLKKCYFNHNSQNINALVIDGNLEAIIEQPELRSKLNTEKILKKMKKNSLGYKMEVILSNHPKLWEDAGIPIPDSNEIYGYRYCTELDDQLKRIQEDITKTPSAEFSIKVDHYYHKISQRDTILRSFILRVSSEEEPIARKMDQLLSNAKNTFQEAKKEMLRGIRQDENAPQIAKSKLVGTIGTIRDWIKELREASLETN